MITQPLVSSTRLKVLSRVSKTEANKQSVNSSSRVVLQTTKRGYKIQHFVLASLRFKNKSEFLFLDLFIGSKFVLELKQRYTKLLNFRDTYTWSPFGPLCDQC